jgi:flagellin
VTVISLNTDYSIASILRSFSESQTTMVRALERLSSGVRINSAADDPAGLVISEQMRAQIASLNQEIENVSATVNKYQTVSGSVQQIRGQLTDLRALAVGAANSAVNSESALAAYQAEADSIVTAVNDAIAEAEYNGRKSLDGSSGALLDIPALNAVDFSSPESVDQAIAEIDQAISEVDDGLVELGAVQKNELETNLRSLEQSKQNMVSAESQIRDTDFGDYMSAFVSSLIQQKAALALVAHSRISAETVLSLLSI